jgi:beta-alanine--pyruvate transaminase
MGHSIAFFTAALAKIASAGLDRIFLTTSGSESVDTALKIALAYHRARARRCIVGDDRRLHPE